MIITGFNPMVISPKADDVIQVFADLGFEKTHAPVTQTETGEVECVRMKDSSGFHVDVANLDYIPKDMTYIRVNVDNFAEAYEILIARGFKNTRGDGTIDSGSAKAATMVSPSGFTISLVEHIKNND